MAQASSMKQIGSRNMGCMVERMEWSNKMDLIAIGTNKGEVIIQRLNWQKIVTFPTLGDDVFVRSLSWQRDETMLAAGYSNGTVALLDAEREDLVANFSYDEDIRKVYFSKPISVPDFRTTYRNHTELKADFFLPKLPQLNAIGASAKSIEEHKSFAKSSPCFLVIVLTSGKVFLLLLGALKGGHIDLSNHVLHCNEFDVYDVQISGNCNSIYALVRDGTQLKVLHFHNKMLQQFISPLLDLAVHSANILETKIYINDTIQCMLEAWETVLLEMDNKLTKYANQQHEGSLSADFLELLVFGYATNEIEEFLMDDLTEKGLKKLANSVDLSYSTIQTLIAKPLQSATINMFYFLNTVKGLARITYFFNKLISPEAADDALRKCGAFIMKVLEMQQVVDQCVKDLKLFFSWLCVVIVRLHQQDVTEDMIQLTPEDTIYLADYLHSFDDTIVQNDGTVTKRRFNLEKVGQYLENKKLQQIVKPDPHHLWKKVLEDNECLRNCSLLYPHEKETSLVQQQEIMLNAIDTLFKKPDECISANFELNTSIICCELHPADIGRSNLVRSSYHVNDTTKCDILVTTIGWQEVLILQFNKAFTIAKCVRLQLKPGPFTCDLNPSLENLRFVDLHFYNENTISLLLQGEQDKTQSHFVQFPLDAARDRSTQHILPNNINLIDASVGHSIHDIIESSSFKNIEGVCTDLAVSGSRKVATVLCEGKKKLVIFEMEIEDDEEDTEISQNSLLEMSKESATSSQD